MRQKPGSRKSHGEKVVKDIRRIEARRRRMPVIAACTLAGDDRLVL